MTPTIASLMKIAAALGKSVSYFVDEPETPDVSVVRARRSARASTRSKQGLDLRNVSGRYGSFADRRRGGRRRAAAPTAGRRRCAIPARSS